MRSKTFFKNIILILIMAGFIFFTTRYSFRMVNENFHMFKNIFSSKLIVFFSYSIFGALIGVEYILSERKQQGTWKINYYKVIFLIIPCLIISLSFTFMYSLDNIYLLFLREIHTKIILSFRDFIGIDRFSTILLGYALITCIYKDNK